MPGIPGRRASAASRRVRRRYLAIFSVAAIAKKHEFQTDELVKFTPLVSSRVGYRTDGVVIGVHSTVQRA
jgi:hypothetical protein